jgi:prepilin-type N-terminal cleavage/methylation domain-containing protein/prepilin-type processing-associated H-X9-DG protein
MRRRTGFTLVELLVVIAIMAVLLALLAPALRKAREQGQMVYCLGNMRKLSVGWQMYADDNGDKLVGSGTHSESGGTPDGDWWVNYLSTGTYDGSPQAMKLREQGITRGALWPHVNDLNAYKCPADPRTHFLRSYSIQNNLNGDPGWAGQCGTTVVYKLAAIKSPQEVFVFLGEYDPRAFNWGSWVVYGTGYQWIDPITAWHSTSTSFGFADGHAERRTWVDPRTLDIARDQTFFTYTPFNPDLQWLQRGFKAAR